MNIQHSSKSNEWGTPPEIMELVREVLNKTKKFHDVFQKMGVICNARVD